MRSNNLETANLIYQKNQFSVQLEESLSSIMDDISDSSHLIKFATNHNSTLNLETANQSEFSDEYSHLDSSKLKFK